MPGGSPPRTCPGPRRPVPGVMRPSPRPTDPSRWSYTPGRSSMADPTHRTSRNSRFDSDCAGILEGAGEHRAVRVERRLELFGGPGPCPSAVFEVPTLRRREDAHVPLAQLAGSRAAVGRSVEPDGEVARVEGEGRRGRRVASRSRTMTSHDEDGSARSTLFRASLKRCVDGPHSEVTRRLGRAGPRVVGEPRFGVRRGRARTRRAPGGDRRRRRSRPGDPSGGARVSSRRRGRTDRGPGPISRRSRARLLGRGARGRPRRRVRPARGIVARVAPGDPARRRRARGSLRQRRGVALRRSRRRRRRPGGADPAAPRPRRRGVDARSGDADPVGPPPAARPGPVRGRGVQHRPDRAAGRGAGRGRRRRAADRDRGPPAPGPPARPRPRHAARDRRRRSRRAPSRRGCRDRVRRPPRSSTRRAPQEIAAALPAGGRTRVLAIADVGAR